MTINTRFCDQPLALVLLLAVLLLANSGLHAVAEDAPASPAAHTKSRPAAAQTRRTAPRSNETASTPAPTSAGQLITRIPPPGPAEVPLFPARDYADSRSGIALTVPAGWLVIEAPDLAPGEISRFLIEGPGLPAPSCGVVVAKPQQPANVTQAQLNKVLQDNRSLASVRNTLQQQGRRVISMNKALQSGVAGISSQVLVPGSSAPKTAPSPDITLFVTFFERPGKRFSFNCNALTADLDTMRPDISLMVNSVRFN